MEANFERDRSNDLEGIPAAASLPKSPIHPKLVEAGVTQEALEEMGVGAILVQACPDCGNDIFYTLTGEYYDNWKHGKPIGMILNCNGCEDYKFGLTLEKGELLYEREGTPELRSLIPLTEHVPSLPRERKRDGHKA